MSRTTQHNVTATKENKHEKFAVPSSGIWDISYGKDHTEMGYFIDFEPVDDEAKKHCSVSWDGREETDDEPAPIEKWEYNPICLDQLFTSPQFELKDFVDILLGFGIKNILI